MNRCEAIMPPRWSGGHEQRCFNRPKMTRNGKKLCGVHERTSASPHRTPTAYNHKGQGERRTHMGLKELLQRKTALLQEAADIRATIEPALITVQEQIVATEKELNELLSADLVSIRKLQEKEFGAVHITKDGYRVTETIPKKVKWDQEKLFGVFQKIQSAGDNPFSWMKAEFKVGEKEYNTYPKEIQSVFAPARTVTPGEPKVEFKELEAANA